MDNLVYQKKDKCVISKVNPADAQERPLRLVGSFPKARLVLGEVAENLCVGVE